MLLICFCLLVTGEQATWLLSAALYGLQVQISLMSWAGHDENEQTEKLGQPVERMLKMARAMLEAVRSFKISKGTPLRIRIGVAQCCMPSLTAQA